MSDLLDRLRKAAHSSGDKDESGIFVAAGKQVVCPHCGSDRFEEGRVLLNSTVLTLFDLDWADRNATILSCRKCSRIEWFARRPDRQ